MIYFVVNNGKNCADPIPIFQILYKLQIFIQDKNEMYWYDIKV